LYTVSVVTVVCAQITKPLKQVPVAGTVLSLSGGSTGSRQCPGYREDWPVSFRDMLGELSKTQKSQTLHISFFKFTLALKC